jgi:hypothetical protein
MRFLAPKSLILSAMLVGATSGCDTGAGAPAQLVPVKGKVTYKGQPLTRGVVRFRPVDSGRQASGQIQPDGSFMLSTFKDGDGAAIGRHQVSFSGTGAGAKAKEVVPKKYLQPITSKLEVDVSPEKAEFNFDLN